jgi:hypothetical protein
MLDCIEPRFRQYECAVALSVSIRTILFQADTCGSMHILNRSLWRILLARCRKAALARVSFLRFSSLIIGNWMSETKNHLMFLKFELFPNVQGIMLNLESALNVNP